MTNDVLTTEGQALGSPLESGRHNVSMRKARAGFLSALLCLAAAGIAAYISVQRLQNNTLWVEHTYQVLGRLDQVQSLTTDAETAQRGFVITADDDYAAQYAAAARGIHDVEGELRTLTADNAAQQQRLARLNGLIADRLAGLRSVMDIQRTEGFAAAQRRIEAGPGKHIHIQLRELIDEIANVEHSLLRERQQRMDRSTTMALAISFSSSLVALVCMAWAAAVTRREFAWRRRAEEALQVANHELDERVRKGTDELAVANSSLAHNERRFRALIEHSTDGIVLMDPAGTILYRSSRAVDLLEKSPAHMRDDERWTEQMHPDDRASAESVIARVLADPSSSIAVQWRIRRRDGEWIWLEGTAVNLLHDPAVLAIVLNFRDVTRRKEAESRLHAQMARLNLLARVTRAIGERQDDRSIYQAVVGTLVTDLPVDACCICQYEPADQGLQVLSLATANEAAAAALSLEVGTRIAIDGSGLSRCLSGHLVHEHDTAREPSAFVARLARAGMGALIAAPLQTEASVFGILLVARREADSFSSADCEFLKQAGEHIALASHEARLYQALEGAYNDLRKAQQAIFQQERLRVAGQLAAGIAHDINNALSPATIYTHILLKREKSLSSEGRELLLSVEQALSDVAKTVTRMRQSVRPRAETEKPAPISLDASVRRAVEATRPRWRDIPQEQGITIELKLALAAGLPDILGVENEIQDAVMNLVLNALDAMPQGGTLSIRTAFEGADAEGARGPTRISIVVADTGLGMDEQTRQRCLEPFFTTKGERGTGLGLSMAYGMIQRHGGELQIDSELGRGTTIRLIFPIAENDATERARAPEQDQKPSRVLRVLLVDDDPLVLGSLRHIVSAEGHIVTVADGGQSGIDAFLAAHRSGVPFEAVITDLGMPYVDGRRVASAVKTVAPDTLVVLLTGWGANMTDSPAPTHIDIVLSKPPKVRALVNALSRHASPPAEG